jgi:3-oxoacyl-[acyl-carrier-protein] synthase-3
MLEDQTPTMRERAPFDLRLGIRITGIGHYVPEQSLTNHELAANGDAPVDPDWVQKVLGIGSRSIVAPEESTTDMACAAARAALQNGGYNARDIDCLMVATISPDQFIPSTACLIQGRLSMQMIPAYDLNAACAGFLYGLSTAAQFLKVGIYRRILVVGVEAMSRVTDWSRRDCVFFGDGAGAVIVECSETGTGNFDFLLESDGTLGEIVTLPLEPRHWQMNGRAVYDTAVSRLPALVRSLLAARKVRVEDLSLVIPHQASKTMIMDVFERAGIPSNLVATNMDRHANTSAAALPILLSELHTDGRIRAGDLVLFVTIGAGMTWGAALHVWQE